MGALTLEDMEHMSASDRLELISQLWDSLENDPSLPNQVQRDELDRRLSAPSDQAEGASWETLRATLR